MLTRDELIKATKQAHFETRSFDFDLYHCKATYRLAYIKDTRCAILTSYNTIVAVYSMTTGSVYAFGSYSATTTQHIYKFCKAMKASRLIKLYLDSTNEYQVNFDNRGYRESAFHETKKTMRELQERDFYGVIESFTKH